MSTEERSVKTESPELTRGLKNRHLQLIAIGGAIGTGLFMGSGKMISVTGPAVIFVYMVIGLMVFLIMRALGELLLSNLHYKTFGDIAKDLIGPWAGFFVSWTYWLGWVVACVADIIAITSYVSFFNASIPPWIPALIAAVALTLLNLQPVKFFGETEFWFALIKVIAILALIGAGVVLIATGFTNPDSGTRATFANLWDHGGMFPFGASGFILGFQMGIFAFIGVELVGTVAAETENPRKTLPKAINSIVARILVFYVGSLVIIMSITPWDQLAPDKSPFVTTLAYAGFGIAAAAINLVVLTSAASSANSGIYSGSRMLYNLALDGHAHRKLTFLTPQGVPRKSVFLTCVFLFTAIPLLYAGDGVVTAFTFVSSVCATLILFTWGTIVVSYIRYRRRYPERHTQSGFKLPLGRVAPWVVLAFFVFIIGALLYGEDTRAAVIAAPVWFGLLAVAWVARKRRLAREGRPITRSIPVTVHPLDDERSPARSVPPSDIR
ncbi:D-serine/D-alanine/glycine:proton symporter, AAT family [Microbacterium testaceum StLB037]|uniref:D-serine/D-alanine/glycine:proton symporter, AAT family n=1 Tax=Microbacterium testaceum (strain StLB037) TaxID=979556 RepID=A0A1H0QKA3_MICTS|nr:amino acid permease [Microbacterium testaceum]SDP17189.1 D-serine/D-alanine/glycine:proton symporter, AAT family [Microbacterium testaceum StLB037]